MAKETVIFRWTQKGGHAQWKPAFLVIYPSVATIVDLNKGLLQPGIMDLLLSPDHLAYFSDLLHHQHFNNKVTNDILRLLSPDTGHVRRTQHSLHHTRCSDCTFSHRMWNWKLFKRTDGGGLKRSDVLHIIYTCLMFPIPLPCTALLHCLCSIFKGSVFTAELIPDLTRSSAVKFPVWNSAPIKCILSFMIFVAQVIALIAVDGRDQLRIVVPVGNTILQSGGDLVLPRPSAAPRCSFN